MLRKLTIARSFAGEDRTRLTRSDGEVFHFRLIENGAAIVYHDKEPLEGLDIDSGIEDQLAHAEMLVLAYPAGWF